MPAPRRPLVPEGRGEGTPPAREDLGRPAVDELPEEGRATRDVPELDALDPTQRQVAQLAPPFRAASIPAEASAEPARRVRSLEELLPELVRRVAWSGDGKRGAVRLELAAGAYAGASVLVHADGPRVRVELGGLPEPTLARLRERLETRLRERGLDLEGVS